MMLADIMFRKGEFDNAAFRYQQIFEKALIQSQSQSQSQSKQQQQQQQQSSPPQNVNTPFVALAKLIRILRAAGRLENVPKLFDYAQQYR